MDRCGKLLKEGSSAIYPSRNREKAKGDQPMKLLDQVRAAARVKHFSYRTEQCYVYWIERYIRHHGIRHPKTMAGPEVEQFLTHLAVAANVSASTQNQALKQVAAALGTRQKGATHATRL